MIITNVGTVRMRQKKEDKEEKKKKIFKWT